MACESWRLSGSKVADTIARSRLFLLFCGCSFGVWLSEKSERESVKSICASLGVGVELTLLDIVCVFWGRVRAGVPDICFGSFGIVVETIKGFGEGIDSTTDCDDRSLSESSEAIKLLIVGWAVLPGVSSCCFSSCSTSSFLSLSEDSLSLSFISVAAVPSRSISTSSSSKLSLVVLFVGSSFISTSSSFVGASSFVIFLFFVGGPAGEKAASFSLLFLLRY